jgi:hypothetical protein
MAEHKYIETQTRKIISSYGGVGSIIESTEGALMVEEFDKWPYFIKLIEGSLNIDDFKITDNRLLKRLQHEKGFPNLKEFIKIPANTAHYKIKNTPVEKDLVIGAKYFPKWFYCNNCDRFHAINDWWKLWEQTMQKYHIQPDKSNFIPPKCYHCFDESKKKGVKKNYFELEQVRFIMTSPSGEISDIPWERWNKAVIEKKDEDSEAGQVVLDFANLCCEKQDLRYLKSTKFSDLTGIQIKCSLCGESKNLSGLFGLRLKEYNKDKYKKPVIRTSNSVYYPISITSIFLPTKRDIDIEDQKAINEWIEEGEDLDFIFKALRKKYEKEKIEAFIKNEIYGAYEPEIEYRLKEYSYIIENEQPNDDDLLLEPQKISKLEPFGIEKLTAIKRLKVTTVQTGYTRQEPLDKDIFLSGENIENASVEPRYTSSFANATKYLPAVENFGEGIFISLSKEKINNWLTHAFKDDLFNLRIDNLWENNILREFGRKEFEDKNHLAKFLLVHTFSHIIIKELEFLCGYATTSLNERLFIDCNTMQGVLIYTVAGAEGSYGGLVSQANEDDFSKVVKSALNRACDCASDPICYHSDEGQGVGGLNLAACYSCALLPENACEEFNSFLDRAVLISKDYGFIE